MKIIWFIVISHFKQKSFCSCKAKGHKLSEKMNLMPGALWDKVVIYTNICRLKHCCNYSYKYLSEWSQWMQCDFQCVCVLVPECKGGTWYWKELCILRIDSVWCKCLCCHDETILGSKCVCKYLPNQCPCCQNHKILQEKSIKYANWKLPDYLVVVFNILCFQEM